MQARSKGEFEGAYMTVVEVSKPPREVDKLGHPLPNTTKIELTANQSLGLPSLPQRLLRQSRGSVAPLLFIGVIIVVMIVIGAEVTNVVFSVVVVAQSVCG